jgi:hypothetical protein
MKVKLNKSEVPEHPLLLSLQETLQESGIFHTTEDAPVEIILGDSGQGFSQTSIKKIEDRIQERFLGAELFLQARAFPFARIRCGLDSTDTLLVACPIEDGLIYRLVKLLQQYKQVEPKNPGKTVDPIGLNPIDMELEDDDASNFAPPLSHWKNELFTIGLSTSSRYPVIQDYSSYPAVHHLLQSTTARRVFTNENGDEFAIFGFPDLLRPSSNVLVLSKDGGVLALHRKQQTVLLSPKLKELIVLEKNFEQGTFEETYEEIFDENTTLLGYGDGLVYCLKGDMVYSLNSGTLKKMGKKPSVIASLCLQWSSK